jgi:hypothetical protein
MWQSIGGGEVMSYEEYRGWKIYYYPVGSQHWRAEQYGVGMCANSEGALKRMIDVRQKEVQERQGAKW